MSMNHQWYNWLKGAVSTLYPAHRDTINDIQLQAQIQARAEMTGVSTQTALKLTLKERRQAQTVVFWVQVVMLVCLLILVFFGYPDLAVDLPYM